jgi:putative ABC transport system permease protein
MNLAFDLKYALRLLKKSWGYSLMCAAVVALSVALAVFAFTLSYSQLMKPISLPGAENWYSIQIAADAAAVPRFNSVDAYTYQEMLKANRSATHLGAFTLRRVVLSEGQASTSLRGSVISPRLLSQVVPLLGRPFQESDARPGAATVAILSYEAWRNYFAGDPAIIGKTARLDSAPVQIVGVMAEEFYAFSDSELWMPLQLPTLASPGDSKLVLSPFIALGANDNLATLSSEMKSAVDRVNSDYPDLFKSSRHVMLISGARMLTYEATPIIVLLIFIPAAVMLLGGVNISMVFLARLLERSRELALRTALGASRSRLLRQCLMETAGVVLLGLVVGSMLAAMFVRWSQVSANTKTLILASGRVKSMTVELRPIDLLVAVVAATVIWLLSTLIPAWRIARQDPTAVLSGSGKGASNGGKSRGAGLLVGMEVVISCVVLVVCGSIVLASNKELHKPTGINSSEVVVTTSPTVFDARYTEPAPRLRYLDDLKAAIENKIPGTDVAFTSAIPSNPSRVPAAIETQQGAAKEGTFTLPVAVVPENYFALLGLRLRSGRFFDATDNGESLDVAIVDESLAARYWPGQDALGKRVRLNPADNGPWLTIVGVVSSVAGQPYRDDDSTLYQPLRQAPPRTFHLLARLPNTVTNARADVREAAFTVDRDLPLNNVQKLDDYMGALKVEFNALIEGFTALALIVTLITASGLFGLISRSVAQRTQEVGIRRALGATPRQATSMFVRQGAIYLSLAIVGVALGVLVLPGLSKGITNILDYAIVVTVGVMLVMTAVVVAASYFPSRRAVALDPGDALRYE